MPVSSVGVFTSTFSSAAHCSSHRLFVFVCMCLCVCVCVCVCVHVRHLVRVCVCLNIAKISYCINVPHKFLLPNLKIGKFAQGNLKIHKLVRKTHVYLHKCAKRIKADWHQSSRFACDLLATCFADCHAKQNWQKYAWF